MTPGPLAAQAPTAPRGFGLPLLVIATAQLMLVLDDAIANIALPSIQQELVVSASALPWVINAYLLAFGGLLLFGGRAGDLFGRRRMLRAGLVLFTLASLLGGLGVNIEMLVAARGLQGLGAALAAPNALALIATTFPPGKPRNSAMAVYGAMSALGLSLGVVLGGVLTGALGWRWVFFINVPIGLAVLAGTAVLVEGERDTGRLGVAGALCGAAAVVALTYGITRGGEHAWTDLFTLGAFGLGAVLLAVFLWVQARSAHPMLPLWLLRERNRSGAYATMLFTGGGLMGTFYLMTLYLQQVLQMDAMTSGLASLPFSVGIVFGVATSSRLVERLAPRLVAGPGLLVGAAGMLWLSALSPHASYFAQVLPGVFLASFGLGMSVVTMTLVAVHGVPEDRTGVASALVNMAQQLGAALGLATLTTVATTVSNRQLPHATQALHAGLQRGDADAVSRAGEALGSGYSSAYAAGAAMLVVAAMVMVAAINTRTTQRGHGAGTRGPNVAPEPPSPAPPPSPRS